MVSWGFIILSTTFSVLGQLMLKYAMLRIARVPSARPVVLRIVTSPYVIGGLAVYGLGVISWLLAMSSMPITVLYPFASLAYVGIIIGSYFLFRENITRARLIGIAIIIAGVALIGLSAAV